MQCPRSYGPVSGRKFARKKTASGTRFSQKKRRTLPDGRAASAIYDRHHRRLREAFFGRNPWCADCLARGQHTPATELHHLQRVRERPDLRLDPDNCRALCEACHSARTARGE